MHPCDVLLAIQHNFLFGSDFIEARKQHFTGRSLRMLFEDVSFDFIVDHLEEINFSGKVLLLDNDLDLCLLADRREGDIGFKVLLSFLPLQARNQSYIRTRHSL